MKRPQLAGLVATAAIVIAGKQWFRTASVEDLRFLLAPTARCTSVLVGKPFVPEAAGYANHALDFVIAPVCAGLNFMLAAILALSLGWLSGMTTWTAMAKRVGGAVALAYVATIIVNTLRITLSIELHATGTFHQLLGIAIYLGGLCALYAMATQKTVVIPLVAYLAITLALPLVHGAANRTDFGSHALWVVAACLVIAAVAWVTNNRTTLHVGDRS